MLRSTVRSVKELCNRHLLTKYYQVVSRFTRADISIFHQFSPPPSGGGHQFMRALWHQFEKLGLRIENNAISKTTRACLMNSFNFDDNRLRCLRHQGCRMYHRVDGPISVYRGWNDGTDERIYELNHEFASKTIFQSQYSLQKHVELGFRFKSPQVVINTADPEIFHAEGRVSFSLERKIRLISISWSDNPNKGGATYEWLDGNLDWSRFEYTFVGRVKAAFENITHVPPISSQEVARLLRDHDIFITASKNDPCSNALIEALACGLPAIYFDSGGHPEIVGRAGLGFSTAEEIPSLIEELIEEYGERQSMISIPDIQVVAQQYLEIMDIAPQDK